MLIPQIRAERRQMTYDTLQRDRHVKCDLRATVTVRDLSFVAEAII